MIEHMKKILWETKFNKQNKVHKAVDCFVNILFILVVSF